MAAPMVETKHPLGKNNKPVRREDYELFKATIVAVLRDAEPTYTELASAVASRLPPSFRGNVDWHTMTVKLDLEARGIIERTRSKPERYRVAA